MEKLRLDGKQAQGGKDDGATLLEYLFILLLIAFVVIVAASVIGPQASQLYSKAGSAIKT